MHRLAGQRGGPEGCSGKDINLLPLTGFKHRTVQPVILWLPAHKQILTLYANGLLIEFLNWMYSYGQTAGKKFTAFRMTGYHETAD